MGICSFASGKGKRDGQQDVRTHRAHRSPEECGQNAHTPEPGARTVSRRGEEPHAGDSPPDRNGRHQTQGERQSGEGNPDTPYRK